MRIAIVGSGVSGLVCAHLLRSRHDVVLYEADARLGGHAHTHRVSVDGHELAVDTGFLVYNERTYPLFSRLLSELGVETQPSDMSFSVSDARTGLEWRGTSPRTVFSQSRNILRREFWAMLADIGRFNRLALRLLEEPPSDDVTLEDVLEHHRWSRGFLEWYLIPLGSSIWSANPSTFLRIPAATFARFFERHGLLRLRDQPRWRTVTGGSIHYVDAITRPLRDEGRIRLDSPVEKIARGPLAVELMGPFGVETYDHVILATHSDQAMQLLSDPDRLELETVGAIRYQSNRATLHTDRRLLPRATRAWASWNYHRVDADSDEATLTYLLNGLQSLRTATPVLVTLNRDDTIDPETVLAQMDYAHPILDTTTIAAQRRRTELTGRRNTSYCGAYWGYGFHEDGVRSAVETCRALGVSW